jgi:regulatory protein
MRPPGPRLVPRRSSKPPPPPGGAFHAAVGLLARRSHSGSELRRKLGRRGYDPGEVDAAVARLAELGLQDDRAFAESHVRRRSRSLGPLALSAELSARGIDRRLADAAMAHFTRDEQVASATGLAERLCARKPYATYRALLDSVGPKLMRRGFSMAVARAACEAAWRGAGD